MSQVIIERYEEAPASYHPHDPDAFAVARLLADAIRGSGPGLAVEHVGSTSVAGCAGKGVIDLMVLYPPGLLPLAKGVLDGMGFQRQSTRSPTPTSSGLTWPGVTSSWSPSSKRMCSRFPSADSSTPGYQ